jgi:UDP-glucose 4-epimerase
VAARRILVTAVSNYWGSRLAARLAAKRGVERVIGLDTRAPDAELASRIDFIEADVRSEDLPRLVRAADPDVVVHNDILQFAEPGRAGRQLHDINVIGTLSLLTACEGLPSLRAIVVRGSAAIYGAEPSAPAFFTEDMAERYPLRTRFQRDLGELENLFATFARRHPEVTCTTLRMQPILGPGLDSPITRLLRAPVVPTFLGYDPRVQVLDADDSVAALAAAVARPVRGAVNVAGEGTVSLQRMLRRMRRPSLPIAAPLFGTVVGIATRLGLPEMAPEVPRYLRYGRGVDLTRMREELRFAPALTTEQAIERVVAPEHEVVA